LNFNEFEFSQPHWLWLAIIPLLLWWLQHRYPPQFLRIRQYADAHLLPHLLINTPTQVSITTQRLWTVLWLLGILALAGPRWDYEEQEVVRPHANLMILLDLSDSMRVKDLPHSRLEEALQNIEDLIKEKSEIYIGLMVFAGIPHLVSPLTDDYQTLRYLLYELKIEMLPVQGSRLNLALNEATHWLKGQTPEEITHILLISDGEFEEDDLQKSLKFIGKNHFYLHTFGVGTTAGDFIPMEENTWKKDEQDQVVISKLNEANLQQLATVGKGIYQHASYRQEDTQTILAKVKQSISDVNQDKTTQKLWHERFYLLVGIMAILILPWFRRF